MKRGWNTGKAPTAVRKQRGRAGNVHGCTWRLLLPVTPLSEGLGKRPENENNLPEVLGMGSKGYLAETFEGKHQMKIVPEKSRDGKKTIRQLAPGRQTWEPAVHKTGEGKRGRLVRRKPKGQMERGSKIRRGKLQTSVGKRKL